MGTRVPGCPLHLRIVVQPFKITLTIRETSNMIIIRFMLLKRDAFPPRFSLNGF